MTTNGVISEQRAAEILSAYGADSRRWPEEERDAMGRALEAYPKLTALCSSADALDKSLAQYSVNTAVSVEQLLQAIDTQLPITNTARHTSNWLERILDWLVPPEFSASAANSFKASLLWRGAVAAAIPIGVGVWLGAATAASGDDWSDSESYVFAPYTQEVIDG